MSGAADRYAGMTHVWKFGYGSNLGPEFLRVKKGINPLESKPSILKGWQLSFPQGIGIDWVEPAFASLKKNPTASVHGVSTLLSIEDAERLNRMEPPNIQLCKAVLYDGAELDVEIYLSRKELPLDHPEGVCSERYRDILVKGAEEMSLDASWIEKLRALPVYTPSSETLALRAAMPSPGDLPAMTIQELAKHDGQSDQHSDKTIYTSVCGFIFEHKEVFGSYHGRDVTYRNVLHSRGKPRESLELQVAGINLDANDDGGRSPFPRLSQLEPSALEYALRYRDRFTRKSPRGRPIAVLKEFWEQQEVSIDGLFTGNSWSRLGLSE